MTFIESKIQEAEELMQRNQRIQSWEDLSDKDLDRVLYLSNRVFCEAAAVQRAGRLSEPINDEQVKRVNVFLACDQSLGGFDDELKTKCSQLRGI